MPLYRIVMNRHTMYDVNRCRIRVLRMLFNVFTLICFVIINVSFLLNQTAVASEEGENSPNFIREGEEFQDIIKDPDASFYVRRYSESLSRYFNSDGAKEQGGNGSSLEEAFVVDKQKARVLTIFYDVIGKFPDVGKIVKVDNKIYYIFYFSVQEDNKTKYFQVFCHMKNLTKLTPPSS